MSAGIKQPPQGPGGPRDLTGLRVAYIGDWVFYTGPKFIESPFEMMSKDCHLQFLGKPVTEALSAAGATVRGARLLEADRAVDISLDASRIQRDCMVKVIRGALTPEVIYLSVRPTERAGD